MNIRTLLLASSVATLGMSMTMNAHAQTSVQQDEIVVTGSRIERDPNAVAAVPIQSLDSEDIVASGEFNLVDVVNDIPALNNSISVEQSIDSAFATGTSVLNLRGLGVNRTLTLINNRRSVAGVEGSAAVDISSIPNALVERVEVLTGGASAIYGADAVSGVVNFILKDDFEGTEINLFTGANGSLDGEQFSATATHGRNFDNDRGNFVISVNAARDTGLRYNESDQLLGGPASAGGEWENPARRFQNGEITASGTPSLARFYNFDNTGRFRYGFSIPSEADFIDAYTSEFGTAPDLNAAERAFFARATNAPARTVIDQPVFSITSGYGVIGPGNAFDFTGFNAVNGIDLDGNGREDCLDSFVGFNSSGNGFGFAGGCWAIQQDGSIRPFQDSVITGDFNRGAETPSSIPRTNS